MMACPYISGVVSHLISNRKEARAMDVSRLHVHPPMEIAEELTLLDAELLRKISSDELRDGAWMDKAMKYELAPNVMAMVETFNRVALLVPTEILEETTPKARAKVISIFIKVASKCYQLRNYNSLRAVLAGLQCTPIYRLKKTWKEVPSKRRKRFKQLSELMSEEDNWVMYLSDLDQQFAANTPCIPFLGIFLTQIVQQDSYNQCKPRTGCGVRKHSSALGNYTILEAITLRNQLEKLARQHSVHKRGGKHVPCTTSRRVGHRERDESEPTSETDDTQSPLAPAQSTVTQPVQPSEQHLKGERQQASLQNSEVVSVPLQLSPSAVVAVSPCGTNQAKPCRVIQQRSMSHHTLDVAELGTQFNNITDANYMRSQSLESLQDSESSIDSSRSSSCSANSLDSLSSNEEQFPAFKLPPNFITTMTLPNGGLLSPTSWAASTCICNRRRRATIAVLRLNLARISGSISPSDLLQRYQFFSLGCCRGVESRVHLRALLTDTVHNTEGQNYQLSYQREL